MTYGFDAKLYRNTGTHSSPVWSEIAHIRDLTLTLEADDADLTTRAGGGWRATGAALRDATIEFDMLYVQGDAEFDALNAAFFAKSPIEVAVLDGDVNATGSQGLRATCVVTGFTRNEQLSEGITYSVALKPTLSEFPPEWMTVGA